jgi:regulator of RNase E activity RraB
VIPTRLYHQLDLDDSTLAGLAKHGDHPKREHDVEHHFFADEADPLRALSALGAKLGFRPGSIVEAEHEGHRYFHVDLVSRTAVTTPSVYRESLLMGLLAESFDVEYDGWGTLVAK